MGRAVGKYIKKLFLVSKSRLAYLKYWLCKIWINPEHFSTNFCQTGDKYIIKIICDIKWRPGYPKY